MINDDELLEDPCRAKDTYSGLRFLAFVLIFVGMLGGGGIVVLAQSLYWILPASVLGYTASVMLYGFARNQNGNQSFLFTCPVVVSQYPRLLKRHAGYLAVLIVLEANALLIKPNLSAWWLTSSGKDVTPFSILVAMLVGALAVTEILTNRGLLERAHNDRFGKRRS